MEVISSTMRKITRQSCAKIWYLLVLTLTVLLSSCGGGGSSADSDKAVPTGSLSLLAGSTAGAGNFDGVGAAASFYWPEAIAVTGNGVVYVADTNNNKIRKIMPDGTVTTLAGSGEFGRDDGMGTAASFNSPMGVAVGSNGTVYVVDTGNNAIRMVTTEGKVTTLAGIPGVAGHQDTGTGLPLAQAQFNYPIGIAIDASNAYLYVADGWNNAVRKVGIADGVVTTLAGGGTAGDVDDVGALAQFDYPWGVVVDAADNVYVADEGNNKIRKIAPDGTVSTLAGSGVFGYNDGAGADAAFASPRGMALFDGALYIASGGEDDVRKVALVDGVVTAWAGGNPMTDLPGSADGTRAQARFNRPEGIAVDASGVVYVADTSNHAIRKIVPNDSDILVSTLAGAPPTCSDGTSMNAVFCGASAVTWAADGTIYVATAREIKAITPGGDVSFLAGGDVIGCQDGQGSEASFSRLTGLTVGPDGFIYATDSGSWRIRKISPEGYVTTLVSLLGAGSRVGCYAPAFVFDNNLVDVAVSADGTVYATDSNNTILKIVDGVVETLAGSGLRGNSDGSGAVASFSSPTGIVVRKDGTIYVTDSGNGSIRKITPAGVVSTLAGGSYGHADGVGGMAGFSYLGGLAMDAGGNLFVADTNNNLIRKVTPNGVVTTVVGSYGKMGITLGELPATLAGPSDVAVDGAGRLLITSGNAVLVAEKPGGF